MPYLFLYSLFFFGVIRIGLFFIENHYKDEVDLVTNFPISSQVFDKNGGLLYEFFDEVRRIPVAKEDVPEYLVQATLLAEDENFFLHAGFDPVGIMRAAWRNWQANEVQEGASTLGQQLIKNTVLGPSDGYQAKLDEVLFSVAVDARLSKQDIVHLYLNTIPYGSNVYGAEAASRYYFGKSVKDISINEAAILAALPKHPTYLSPYGENVADLRIRKNYVLQKMKNKNYITEDEYKDAIKDRMFFADPEMLIRAPHFVMMVKEELIELIGQKALYQDGYAIHTTLDPYLQYQAEQVFLEQSDHLDSNKANSAGLVAIDPQTGSILSMVGNRDYFDQEHSGNFNMTLAKRQPGSTFKPLVYATLLEKHTASPATILLDKQKNFGTKRDPYIPQNYDKKFRGRVTVREALAMSLNVPAVQALVDVGLEQVLDTVEDLGLSTLSERERFGPSLVLGGGEVQLVEMVEAFSTFANYGTRMPAKSLSYLVSSEGERLLIDYGPPQLVLRPETAFQMTSILSDNKARSPVFGKNSPLAFDDLTVAAKTGTTQEYRDAWTIGYSKDIAVGVWVGNHDNTPLRYGAAGSVVAGPIWRGFIDKYYEQNELIAFEAPNDLEKIRIRTASGYRQEYIAPWQQENYQKPLVRRRPSVVVIP